MFCQLVLLACISCTIALECYRPLEGNQRGNRPLWTLKGDVSLNALPTNEVEIFLCPLECKRPEVAKCFIRVKIKTRQRNGEDVTNGGKTMGCICSGDEDDDDALESGCFSKNKQDDPSKITYICKDARDFSNNVNPVVESDQFIAQISSWKKGKK